MDPLSAVAAAVGIGKASIEGVQAIRKRLSQAKLSKDDLGEIREAVQGLETGLLESQNTILDLKAAILELREEKLQLGEKQIQLEEKQLELREENSQLAEKLRAKESRTPDRKRYERKKVGRGIVIVDPDEPGVYMCAQCFERNQTGFLNPTHGTLRRVNNWTHQCSQCKSGFMLKY